jgi:ArsR family transcriptional regulator, arsenate/arsenite/antimonite-responsive transcriptional repressor
MHIIAYVQVGGGMDKLPNLFKALSDKTRLRIMNALLRADKALCICEIMDTLALPQYTISKHVRELKIAGLVGEQKLGRFVFYSLKSPDDGFHENVMGLLRSSLPETFPEDDKRLKKRLSLRAGNVCVVGMKRKCVRGQDKC